MFQTGTDFEKAGATNALYWANIPLQYLGNTPAFTEEYATAESRAARNALNDLWQRKRELFLQEFVTNSDVDVRRSLIPALDLNSDSYPDSLRHLVTAAIQIARTHSDDYIRHRVEVQLGTERKVDPMSSTTFRPVFSVGASRHPLETLDTGAEGAAGRRRPGRDACAPPHQKNRMVSLVALTCDTARSDGDS
jgi:hypothetical protein